MTTFLVVVHTLCFYTSDVLMSFRYQKEKRPRWNQTNTPWLTLQDSSTSDRRIGNQQKNNNHWSTGRRAFTASGRKQTHVRSNDPQCTEMLKGGHKHKDPVVCVRRELHTHSKQSTKARPKCVSECVHMTWPLTHTVLSQKNSFTC